MAVSSISVDGFIVEAPNPPTSYTAPSGVSVSNATQLETELADVSPQNIILQDGTYAASGSFFTNDNGHSLYAQNLGGATLQNGLYIDAADTITQGLDFDISNAADEAGISGGGCIRVNGSATGTEIYDCTFEGNAAAASAVSALEPSGLIIKRLVALNMISYGVLNQRIQGQNTAGAVPTPSIISDIEARNIVRSTPGAASGTAEFGLWAGHTGTYQRIFASGCGWGGVWMGNACHGSYFTDIISISHHGVSGMYFERYSHGCYVGKFYLDGDIHQAVSVEYANATLRGTSIGTILEYGYCGSKKKGLVRDLYSHGFTIRRCKFVGQKHYALNNYLGDFAVDPWDVTDNDYTDIGSAAVETTTAHDNTFNG